LFSLRLVFLVYFILSLRGVSLVVGIRAVNRLENLRNDIVFVKLNCSLTRLAHYSSSLRENRFILLTCLQAKKSSSKH